MPTYRYNKSLPTGFVEGEGGQIVKDQTEYDRLKGLTEGEPITRRYNMNAVSTGTLPTATTTETKTDPVADFYTNLVGAYKVPDETRRQALRGEAEREVSGQLAAIDQAYMTMIADERARQSRLAEQGARQISGIGRLSGLAGSSVQAQRQSEQAAKAAEAERAATQALQAKQAYERAQLIGQGQAAAEARFRQEQELAQKAQAAYGEYLTTAAAKSVAPVEVGGYLVDPTTGKVIFAAPEKAGEAKTYTLSAGQKVYDANGNLIAENPAGAAEGKLVTLSPGEIAYNPDGTVFATGGTKADTSSSELLSPTEAAALGVPYGTTKGQAASMGIKPTGDMTTAQIRSFEDVTTRYQADPVISNVRNASVGASIADRVIADPQNAANQLASLYTLVKSLDPNSAVREGEIGLAEQTQSYLSKWGNELNRIGTGTVIAPAVAVQLAQATKDLFTTWKSVGDRRTAQYKAQASGLNIGPQFDTYLGGFASPMMDLGAENAPMTDEEKAYVNQQMSAAPASPQVNLRSIAAKIGVPDDLYVRTAEAMNRDPKRIEAWLRQRAANSGLAWEELYPKAEGGSAAAGTPAEAKKVASAIGQYESGGNYKALGPVLNSGSYKGDRAYGKYQVMGKNIPSWTKEALGKSLTPQQFLADPKAQDAVAEYRMGKLLAQGYGVEDIASIWFSGQPLAKAGNRRDQLGTSVPKYAAAVSALYEKMA